MLNPSVAIGVVSTLNR